MFSVALIGPVTGGELLHWDYQLSHWKPKDVFLIGPWDDMETRSKPFLKALKVKTVSGIVGKPKVLLAPQSGQAYKGQQNLVDFEHPENACYVFGSNHKHVTEEVVGCEPDHRVFIPTATQDEMHSYVAYAVTMYDRKVKQRG